MALLGLTTSDDKYFCSAYYPWYRVPAHVLNTVELRKGGHGGLSSDASYELYWIDLQIWYQNSPSNGHY